MHGWATYGRDITGLTVPVANANMALNFGGAAAVKFTDGPDGSEITLNGMIGVGLSAGVLILKGSYNIKVCSAKPSTNFSCVT